MCVGLTACHTDTSSTVQDENQPALAMSYMWFINQPMWFINQPMWFINQPMRNVRPRLSLTLG